MKLTGLPIEDLLGMGSDGCSVFMGKHKGVVARLQKLLPKMLHAHCMCHRGALGAKSAAKSTDYLWKYWFP